MSICFYQTKSSLLVQLVLWPGSCFKNDSQENKRTYWCHSKKGWHGVTCAEDRNENGQICLPATPLFSRAFALSGSGRYLAPAQAFRSSSFVSKKIRLLALQQLSVRSEHVSSWKQQLHVGRVAEVKSEPEGGTTRILKVNGGLDRL